MTEFDAMMMVEGMDGEPHTEEEMLEAWQFLVDTGICWKLQGAYGRMASNLIEQGLIKDKR